MKTLFTTAALACAVLTSSLPALADTVVYSGSGSGQHTTQRFSVGDDWDLKWSYNCENFGSAGNFQVYVNGAPDPEMGVNELGMHGQGTEHFHGGAGKRYLEMNSECDWTVKAVSL